MESTLPERLAVDIALAEFNALRQEIVNRLTTQAALVGVGLTAVGVVIGLVVKENSDHRLLLVIPPLAAGVNLLWWVEARQIGEIGTYIRTHLWPQLKHHARLAMDSWEDYEAKERKRMVSTARAVLDAVTGLLFAGIATVSLAVLGTKTTVGKHEVSISGGLRVVDWILVGIAWAIPVALIIGNQLRARKQLVEPTASAARGMPSS